MEIKRYKDFIKESKEEKDLWIYNGDFRVDESMVLNGKFIRDKIPDVIIGDFSCRYNQLTSLEGAPKEIGKGFYCQNNQLTSLEGSPKEVGGHFICSSNELTSLEGAPKEIGKGFYCQNNQLTSLEGAPKKVGGAFICMINQLTSLEGIPKVNDVDSDLKIENKFINSRSYINSYWGDLLIYMINKKIGLSKIKTWPKGFLTKELINSSKGISKFNL